MRTWVWIGITALMVVASTACGGNQDFGGPGGTQTFDEDGDGFSAAEGDCDDQDASVYPGADDFFGDGIDQNCDEADGFDGDGDGFADPARGGDDCDDEDASVYPGAEEVPWDNRDQDCDGEDLRDYISICGGEFHTCALKSIGVIECFGRNDKDQLRAPANGIWSQIACGDNFSCAVDEDGALDCWGEDTLGQVSNMPSGTFSEVSVGKDHACALYADETPVCWGDDQDSQVSDIPASTQFMTIAAGGTHTCGLLKGDARALCWGSDVDNQLQVPSGTNNIQITAGDSHTCVITSSQGMDCWGDTTHLQIFPSWQPGPYSQVQSHHNHTCGVEAQTVPHCWGEDFADQVSDMPSILMKFIGVGRFHSCGILSENGRIQCWGSDTEGQSSPPG